VARKPINEELEGAEKLEKKAVKREWVEEALRESVS